MRAHWEYAISEGWRAGDGVEVVLTEQGVQISVTQEKAVGSYNEEFTCSVTVPFDQLAGAVSVLALALAKHVGAAVGE